MTPEVEKVVQLGRDSIVQMVTDYLGNGVDVENFSRIVVKTNGESVWVSLLNPIKYLPMGSCFKCSAGVDVVHRSGVSSVPNCNNATDHTFDAPWYKPTKEMDEALQFVLDVINGGDSIDIVRCETFEDEMTIKERETYYDILVVSEFQESSYKIEKKTGRIYDEGHSHFVFSEPLDGIEEKEEVWIQIE